MLLYREESWRMTKTALSREQVFINNRLTILHISRAQEVAAEKEPGRRRWGYIEHAHFSTQAFKWNPQGKRKRGWPRNTWLRHLETNTRKMGFTWSQPEAKAQGRGLWGSVVDDLHPAGVKG